MHRRKRLRDITIHGLVAERPGIEPTGWRPPHMGENISRDRTANNCSYSRRLLVLSESFNDQGELHDAKKSMESLKEAEELILDMTSVSEVSEGYPQIDHYSVEIENAIYIHIGNLTP